MARQQTNLEKAERFAEIARDKAGEISGVELQRAQIYATLAVTHATIALAKGEKK